MRIFAAKDREEFAVRSNGGDWMVSWHSPAATPAGKGHGAAGICLTADGGLVLISDDGERWGLPGGRPDEQESWEQTLHREMLEEACAKVVEARLLGFTQGRCISGPEAGLVLVRSMWQADVELANWNPQFEIAHRSVVPAKAWSAYLWIDDGFAPIFWRTFVEAGLA